PRHEAGREPLAVVEAAVRVRCGECGGAFELSARNARVHRKRGSAPKCSRCRYGAKPPKVTQAMRDYWLERFTLDEIRELAAAMWPDLAPSERPLRFLAHDDTVPGLLIEARDRGGAVRAAEDAESHRLPV